PAGGGIYATHVFQYSSGGMTDLNIPGAYEATAINSAGKIIGNANVPGSYFSYIYATGTTTKLSTLILAHALNNNDQVAGAACYSGSYYHAVLYDHGNVTDLGTLAPNGGISEAFGINNSGRVVGESSAIVNNVATYRAFLYSGGPMSDLGSL